MAKSNAEIPDWMDLLLNRGRKWLEEQISQADAAFGEAPPSAPPPQAPPRGPVNSRDVLILRSAARIVHSYGRDGRRLFERLWAEIDVKESER